MKIANGKGYRTLVAAGSALALIGGPLAASAHAQNFNTGGIGGQIVKVLGGSNSRQGEKNAMRNLGIGLGAVAVYQALNHNTTNALLFGAGAALAGKKYEDARKAQAQDNRLAEYRREYRYREGEPVGYYTYRGDRKLAYYARQRNDNGNWRSTYKCVRQY